MNIIKSTPDWEQKSDATRLFFFPYAKENKFACFQYCCSIFKGIKTATHAYAKGKQKYLQCPRNWVKGYCTRTHMHPTLGPRDFHRGVIFHENAYAKTALPPLAVFPLSKVPPLTTLRLTIIFRTFSMNSALISVEFLNSMRRFFHPFFPCPENEMAKMP